MSSKTLFFNKALFLSDVKRYWWLCLSNTLLLILCCVVPVYDRCIHQDLYSYGTSPTWIGAGIFINIVFSLGTSTILFSYMHFNSSVSTMHSLPVKRGTIFVTKLITSLMFLIVPIVISSVLFAFIAPVGNFNIIDIIKWLYQGVIYAVLILSLTLIVNMMTGNPIGTLVFTIGFAIVPIVMLTLLDFVFSNSVYGYLGNPDNFAQYVYIGPDGLTTAEFGFIYPIMSVAFFIGAYLLYKFRKSEKYGEVISFKFLVPVFIGIIASLASGLSYVYFCEILDIDSLFTLIPFGILGTVIAYMVYKKVFSFKGIHKPLGIYLVCVLCFIGIVKFDITGYEGRIPEISDIESVSIESVKYNPYDNIPEFTKSKDIEAVLKLHDYCITSINDREKSAVSMPICYNLKNGKTLKRKYHLDYEKDKAYLKPLFETREYRLTRFSLIDGKDRSFTKIEIDDRRFAKTNIYTTLYPNNDDMAKLISALKKDMANATYEELTQRSGISSAMINVSWEEQLKTYDKIAIEEKANMFPNSEAFSVYPSYLHTIDMLNKLGYYDSLPKDTDIQSVRLTIRDDISDKEAVSANITDREEIKEIYLLYDSMIGGRHYRKYGNNTVNVYLTFTLNNSHVFDVSCTYDRENIPEQFKKYIK